MISYSRICVKFYIIPNDYLITFVSYIYRYEETVYHIIIRTVDGHLLHPLRRLRHLGGTS